MSQSIEFIIPGPIASDHRRIESWRDRYGRIRKRPLVYLPADYQQFRERARMALMKARSDSDWVTPAKGVRMRMFIAIHIASHKQQKFRKPIDKRGRVLRPRLAPRQRPDHDNIEKCVKDALQRDRATRKRPLVDSRFLYLDDKYVDCYPFPGQEWFTIELGTQEWIRVMVEVVGAMQPHVEQKTIFAGR